MAQAHIQRLLHGGERREFGPHGGPLDPTNDDVFYNHRLVVVLQPKGQQGFHVLPRRWVVERTHAWITRRRRCARDYERLPAHHAAWAEWAAIIQMTRRLAKTPAG